MTLAVKVALNSNTTNHSITYIVHVYTYRTSKVDVSSGQSFLTLYHTMATYDANGEKRFENIMGKVENAA